MSNPIAVFSDIHDHQANLAWLLEQLRRQAPQAMICCGDFSSPATLEILAGVGIPLYFCLGNTDETEAQGFMHTALAHDHLHFGGRKGSWEIAGRSIACTHYPDVAFNESGAEVVFFGHSHRRHESREGDILRANPGDIQNRHGEGPSYLLFDPATLAVDFILQK